MAEISRFASTGALRAPKRHGLAESRPDRVEHHHPKQRRLDNMGHAGLHRARSGEMAIEGAFGARSKRAMHHEFYTFLMRRGT